MKEKTQRPVPLNFGLAHRLASALLPAGPRADAVSKRRAVEEIRYAAAQAVDHVYSITGLEAAYRLQDSQVLVIDRQNWVKANSQTFEILLAPLLEQAMGDRIQTLSPRNQQILEWVGSAEIGAALGFLSTRVLGQYDPYAALTSGGPSAGRLMLLAPNILQVEQELNLEPADFRLWVALHEQTHRVQFAAAPWLADYIRGLISDFGTQLAQGQDGLGERLSQALAATIQGMKEQKSPAQLAISRQEAQLAISRQENKGTPGLDQKQEDVLLKATAVMTLLEGHANVVMDSVDASIVPSVKTIRRRFEHRAQTQGFLPRLMTSLLGMDAKAAQYKQGQAFVQAVIDQVGMEAFNRVWESPQNLPSLQEIKNPDAWVKRVIEHA